MSFWSLVWRRSLSWRLWATSVTLPLLAVGVVHATSVRPMNLEQLTERAGKIFVGRCLQTSTDIDPVVGRPVTTATFSVDRAVKGVAGQTVTIRFVSGAGATSFEPGEETLLFLYEDSDLGLTSPVGLRQGKLKVARDKHGARVVLAPYGRQNLLRNASPDTRQMLGAPAVEGQSDVLSLDRLIDATTGVIRRSQETTGKPR